jgi:hypothetical protein
MLQPSCAGCRVQGADCIYGYDTETKQHSSQWTNPNPATQKTARQVKSKDKRMLIFDSKEFILASQTVNSTYYCDTLRQLRENVQRLRPEVCQQKKWLLHHNNAPIHS